MDKKESIPKRILKSVKKLFAFGFFSSPPFFFLALILFLALLFKIFYKLMFFREPTFLFYISLIIFFAAEVLVLLIFLATHLRAYEFVKEMDYFKISEFDKKIKEKNYIKKKGFLKGTFLEKNLTNFLFFSFYQGVIIMERPFWLIKTLSRTFKNARKNKKEGFNNLYGWRKLYDDMKEKKYIYYPFVLALNKE